MNGIVGEFKSIPVIELLNASHPIPRIYCLHDGDEIIVNAVGFENCFGIKIKSINLCDQHFDPNFICIKKIKREKWWQFWKPKYVAVKLRYIEE